MAAVQYTGTLKFVSNNAYNLIVDQVQSSITGGEEGVKLVKSTGFSSCFSGYDMSSYLGCSISYDYRSTSAYEPGSVCILGIDS